MAPTPPPIIQETHGASMSTGNTVTVACKLPHGLVLRLFDMVEGNEAVAGGGFKVIKRAQPRPEVVVLNGYLTQHKGNPVPVASPMSSYALTHGVDKDFFDRWLSENQELDAVKNGLILAHGSDTAGVARERKDTVCGMEPIDPSNLKGKVKTYSREDA